MLFRSRRPRRDGRRRRAVLAGSTGLFGGTSIIDPDGFPFSAKQTGLLERLTPQAQGGPAEDNGSSKEENNREGPSQDAPSGQTGKGDKDGQGNGKQGDQDNFDKIEKDLLKRLGDATASAPAAGATPAGAATVPCGSCSTLNAADARFCKGCGSSLAPAAPVAPVAKSPAICASCSTANDHDARFCKSCGAKL